MKRIGINLAQIMLLDFWELDQIFRGDLFDFRPAKRHRETNILTPKKKKHQTCESNSPSGSYFTISNAVINIHDPNSNLDVKQLANMIRDLIYKLSHMHYFKD